MIDSLGNVHSFSSLLYGTTTKFDTIFLYDQEIFWYVSILGCKDKNMWKLKKNLCYVTQKITFENTH